MTPDQIAAIERRAREANKCGWDKTGLADDVLALLAERSRLMRVVEAARAFMELRRTSHDGDAIHDSALAVWDALAALDAEGGEGKA